MIDQIFNEFNSFHFAVICGALLLGGFVKGGELFETGHVQTAYQRALILWITARSQGIALQDMPAFLSSSPERWHNPLSEAQYKWDAQEGAIYFHRREDDPSSRVNIHYSE